MRVRTAWSGAPAPDPGDTHAPASDRRNESHRIRRLRHFKNVVETLHHTARGRKAIVSGKAQQANIGRRPNEVFLNLPVIDSVQKRLPIELYAQIGSVLGDFVRTVQIIS